MKDLILLHGALGSREQLQQLENHLSTRYRVHRVNLPGHGGEDSGSFEFSIQGFAEAVLDYVKNNYLSNPSIFGYSMGGFVALYAAAQQLFPIDKIITLATKLEWSPGIAEKESSMLDPVTMENKVPAYVKLLAERHAPQSWKEHLQLTAGLMKKLGEKNPLDNHITSKIQQPVLLLLGDNDKMVSQQETITFKERLPNGKFILLPNTSHPIEKVNNSKLAEIIEGFIGDD